MAAEVTLETNPYAPPLAADEPAAPSSAPSGNVFVASASDATRFVLRHPLAFVTLSLGLQFPLDMADTYVANRSEEMAAGAWFTITLFAIVNVGGLFCWAALLELARRDERNETRSLRAALLSAAGIYLTLLVCQLLTTLLILLGLILLVIPGIYLGMRFLFVLPVVVVERQSVWRSLEASWQFTESRQWITFVFGALFMACLSFMFVWELLFNVLWDFLPWEDIPDHFVEWSWLIPPMWRIVPTLVSDWFTVMTFYGYWHLRQQAAVEAATTSQHHPERSPISRF